MLIGNWDISAADARQWNVKPGFHSFKNDSEWDEGASLPVMFKNRIEFKTFTVTLMIKCAGGRQAIIARCSEILSHLIEPTELTLEGFENKFFAVMTKSSHDETAIQHWHKLTIEFEGYEYAKDETVQTFSGTSEFTVTNPGNIQSPAIVEITPKIGAASIILTGICRDPNMGTDLPVTVRELTTGNTVILDGETGLFTQNGELKAADIDIWALPDLLPGDNKITVNNSRMDIAVRFHPRFI